MIFSERMKITDLVEKWFDDADKEISPWKIDRSTNGVVDALDAMGYLRNNPTKTTDQQEPNSG